MRTSSNNSPQLWARKNIEKVLCQPRRWVSVGSLLSAPRKDGKGYTKHACPQLMPSRLLIVCRSWALRRPIAAGGVAGGSYQVFTGLVLSGLTVG